VSEDVTEVEVAAVVEVVVSTVVLVDPTVVDVTSSPPQPTTITESARTRATITIPHSSDSRNDLMVHTPRVETARSR
jgi:hypothetical protein